MNYPFSLLLLSTSHKTAPLEVREKFSISKDQLPSLRHKLQAIPTIFEFLILNTCNRVEIYCAVTPSFLPSTLINTFCDHLEIDPTLFQKHSFFLHNKEVINHLFNVASGMDSQIIGENEILAQVKDAYSEAKNNNTVGPIFHRLFQKSFQAAKAIHTHTTISLGATSIGSVAAELASRIFGDLSSVRTLLIGTGEAGQITAQALKIRGNHNLTLTNRTFENTLSLASKIAATPLPIEEIPKTLTNFDIVITCTTCHNPLITNHSLSQNPTNPLFLIDLSVPRNICPTITSLPNTYLYNLDDLATIANENLTKRKAEFSKCHSILSHKTDLLWAYLNPADPNYPQTSPLKPKIISTTSSP